MRTMTEDMLVADIVTDVPQAADLFREKRIDFCCGGRVSLKEASDKRGENAEDILHTINQLARDREISGPVEPQNMTEEELMGLIEGRYHNFLRQELPSLAPYVLKVSRVHGGKHPELNRIREIYDGLHRELLRHTEEEEEVVFPQIRQYKKNPGEERKELLAPHVEGLEEEHEKTGTLLKEIRMLTNDFQPPEGACNTFRLVFTRLGELEKNTFEHIHLENNVLFSKVRERF
ncbi:regulator of cell morphogenesis and NO signaling [Salimicrobium album]|uniref:Regulator of cell morphogenesis and NO signaling n=3 Tax=Bacillaceae TaxID=186817 RepID=A0ABY1KX73_9BACI|nr:regulator of cell morphogenesis and NO signaling [Salimicrobium album]SIS88633.1 regulator of cell morphogenesis and NO signaling [Salimicrobium salexigens]